MPSNKKVNTATLMRGASYTLRSRGSNFNMRFLRDEERVVDDPDFLQELEGLFEEVGDAEGEISEKPLFLIKRGVPAPEDYEDTPKAKRLSADRKVRKSRRRLK